MRKKILSLLLCVVILLANFTVLFPAAGAESTALARIVTASDFQQGSEGAIERFERYLNKAKSLGLSTPTGAIFGGDYSPNSDVEPSAAIKKIKQALLRTYPDMNLKKLVFIQGNHDLASLSITPTGFHDMGEYTVYSINEDSFKCAQGTRFGYELIVKALAKDIEKELNKLIEKGDTRPVFVATHLPLHHTKRGSYGDNLYSKHIFDVLNEAGQKLDIVFLFGHNHSSNYDDYIGGAVNYLGKGTTIRIPIPDKEQSGEKGYTDETLNFTYMNCGYVGYSNNTEGNGSVKTLTMGVIEVYPDTLEIKRYNSDGVKYSYTVERIKPSEDSKQQSCSLLCHILYPFLKLVRPVVCLFRKLFGINRTCACGAVRY